MIEIIRFTDFNEYYIYNKEFVYNNTLLNTFLIRMIKKVINGDEPLYKYFNIVDKEYGHKIIVLLTEQACLLYGTDCNIEMIECLSSEISYPLFKRYYFFGNKKIISTLLATNNALYEVEKDRNIYECSSVAKEFNYSTGNAEMGSFQDINQIEEMSFAFSKEYEGGEEIPEDMRSAMWQGIKRENIFVWKDHGEICSLLQVIYDRHDFPEIGNFYTKPEFRCKGYGASLIHRVTKGLLENKNEKVILTTNAKTPGSNIAFQKAGFIKVGDYYRIYKILKTETPED